MGAFSSKTIRTTCNINIAGIPYTKEKCLVLWRKVYIPAMDPMLPPISATIKRVASGIRKAPLIALRLSIPIMRNPTKFTMIKYAAIIIQTFINYLFPSASCIFIARTLQERPNRLMKPSASWWSYKSPVVKDAIDSLYKE